MMHQAGMQHAGMQHAMCDVCGADRPRCLFQRQDRFSDDAFWYVVCEACGAVYLEPRPDPASIGAYYPDTYEAYRPLASLGRLLRWRRRHALSIMRRFVERYHPTPGRLLDVGCATGEFLVEMRDHGWTVEGIELTPAAAAIAQNAYGLDVFVGSVDDFATAQAFDVITLWDVLEHLYAPRGTLLELRQHLHDGGFVVLSIPNMHSFDRHLFGQAWIGWDAPRHLTLFSDPVLRRLAAETGFEVVGRRCILGGPGAFMLSWRFWLEHGPGLNPERPLLRALHRSLPYLLWPYKSLSYLVRRGPIVTYALRKVDV